MSLVEKRARAEEMRTELSALRVQREAALHEAGNVVAEEQLDRELERLEVERNQATLDLEVAKNGGSVEDAIAAMELAAAPPVLAVDTSTADASTPPDTPQPEGASPDEAVVVPLSPETGVTTEAAATEDKGQEK